jgi:hypothetical protein
MQHFYDGQVRRYITQTIRVLSNFVVKYGDGTLHRVPVAYGDADKQAAAILRQNSENKINSTPRIAVYVTSLALDRDRLGDSTYVGKVHIRERDMVDSQYTHGQGKNYTVERLMPTPFKLTMKVDIWSANTDQKLQILEQILVLFNPSLELQTTDNYIDWTSLSVLNLNDIAWSSRQIPVGAQESPIDIATLTLDTPIYISAPTKVKHLGVITKIISNIWEGANSAPGNYIEGLGNDLYAPTTSFSSLMSEDVITITDYHIEVYNNRQGLGQATLLGKTENALPREPSFEIPIRQGSTINWEEALSAYPGKFIAGSSKLYLLQPNGTEITGTVALNPLDPTVLSVTWDPDTLTSNTGIDSAGNLDSDPGYNAAASYRPSSTGTFDAIIDPTTKGPRGNGLDTPTAGIRYLIIEDIGNSVNANGPDAWKSDLGADFIARANDIIEWDGTAWHVIFDSNQETDTMVWQTNIYTGVQYLWNGVSWVKSFEGDYRAGQWRLVL